MNHMQPELSMTSHVLVSRNKATSGYPTNKRKRCGSSHTHDQNMCAYCTINAATYLCNYRAFAFRKCSGNLFDIGDMYISPSTPYVCTPAPRQWAWKGLQTVDYTVHFRMQRWSNPAIQLMLSISDRPLCTFHLTSRTVCTDTYLSS